MGMWPALMHRAAGCQSFQITDPGALREKAKNAAAGRRMRFPDVTRVTRGFLDDELHLTPLEPLAEDPKVTKLRAALDRRVGGAQLSELILAVDAEVRFSWIMLGREPRSSKELLMVYAGILAHGTALGAAEDGRWAA